MLLDVKVRVCRSTVKGFSQRGHWMNGHEWAFQWMTSVGEVQPPRRSFLTALSTLVKWFFDGLRLSRDREIKIRRQPPFIQDGDREPNVVFLRHTLRSRAYRGLFANRGQTIKQRLRLLAVWTQKCWPNHKFASRFWFYLVKSQGNGWTFVAASSGYWPLIFW